MDYIALSDNAARQVIDSSTIFDEFSRVELQTRPYAGGMYWKRQGEHEYPVKTAPNNRQKRSGKRTPESEQIYQEFTTRKRELEARLASLREQLRDAERLNKALKAGRVPTTVVSVLQTIEAAGLGGHFTVVGTQARAAKALRWIFCAARMAAKAVHREEPKRRRDLRQADIVQSLLDNRLLMPEAGLH